MPTYRRPMINELVNVIDNKYLRSVGKGRLLRFTREQIVIEHINRRNYKMMFDARTHHFQGYEPPAMLIRENGRLIKKVIDR